MQKLINVIAILIIAVGAILLAYSYNGFHMHVRDEVIELGPLNLGGDEDVSMPFSPVSGVICLVVGLGLLIYNRKR